MADAPILEERRERIQQLLGILTSRPSTRFPLSGVPGKPEQVVEAIDSERLMRHVRTLSAGPRHDVEDHASALAAAHYAQRELAGCGLLVEQVDVDSLGVTLPAMWARIPAVHPTRRAVVVVAHYDTVPGSPGADDNASGVAGVLEIARVLPRGVLDFVVVVAVVPFEEEPGFAGSKALEQQLRRRGLDVEVAISAEMLGYATTEVRIDGDHGDDLLIVGFPGTQPYLDVLLAAAARWSPGKVRGAAPPVLVPDIGRSDHASFHAADIPALMATDGAEFRNRHYHQESDTAETIDPDFLRASTATLAVGLMALATKR